MSIVAATTLFTHIKHFILFELFVLPDMLYSFQIPLQLSVYVIYLVNNTLHKANVRGGDADYLATEKKKSKMHES